jgi:hypothetical protein
MRKFFKLRITEESDLQRVVGQVAKEHQAQRKFISNEVGRLEQEIERRDAALERLIQYIFTYLPVRKGEVYRSYHNKETNKPPKQNG